nr:protein FAM204A isoform X3 [Anser cygnoides]
MARLGPARPGPGRWRHGARGRGHREEVAWRRAAYAPRRAAGVAAVEAAICLCGSLRLCDDLEWPRLNWKMWSGLLPPGLNESDVDLSSDDGDESRCSPSKEDANEDTERVQLSELQENGPESSATSESLLTSVTSDTSVTDGENTSEMRPPGISLDMWNKFLELQKKNREMKMQASQESNGRKRKRGRKEKLKKNSNEVTKSVQQLACEDQWKELTQYFGINDRFESPVDSRAPQKSGLELSIEKSVAEGDIDKAEELSDRLAIRELGVKIAKAAACRNFVKAKQEAEAAQEARKKKKLAWGFEAKKRWETKSNMGYM